MKEFSGIVWKAWGVILIFCAYSDGSTLETELTLTLGQKQTLDKVILTSSVCKQLSLSPLSELIVEFNRFSFEMKSPVAFHTNT